MNLNTIIQGDARNITSQQFEEKFGVIVADPPWPYQQFSERKNGAASSIYDLMTIEDICAMPVAALSKPNSVLLLWGTWPKLPEALQVLNAWGFEYVTGFPWVKTTKNNQIQYGVGFWVRGCSEFIFIGRKGNVKSPRLEGFLGLLSPNLGHSHKPEGIHEIAESLPGPYLELFARRPRIGWTVFGNQLEDYQPTAKKRPAPIQMALEVE